MLSRFVQNDEDALSNSILGRPAERGYRSAFAAREDRPLRSAAVDRSIEAYHDAEAQGDEFGRVSALREVVRANRADHKAGGVPVYAHMPLPDEFADTLATSIREQPGEIQSQALGQLVRAFEPSDQPLVAQQLQPHVQSAPMSSGPTEAPEESDGGEQEWDPDLQKRADELDESDTLAAIAHPPAYAFDQLMDGLIGKDGLLGDHGWRRGVPPPRGTVPRAIAEAIKFYLEGGPVPAGKLAKLLGHAPEELRAMERIAASSRRTTTSRTALREAEEAKATARSSKHGARQKRCIVSCNVQQIKPGAPCPPRVPGEGTGSDCGHACNAAEKDANTKVPRGCQKRHCHGPCV